MAKSADYPDVFMQFRTIAFQHHASDHTNLIEAYIETGLEIRGGLGWIVHELDLFQASMHGTVVSIWRWAVSTRRGQAVIPQMGDRGCLKRFDTGGRTSAGGFFNIESLHQHKTWRPPILLASRYLALYMEMTADDPVLDGTTSYLRVGYTTLSLTPADYIEIAETWGE